MSLSRSLQLGVSAHHARSNVPHWPEQLAAAIAERLGSPVTPLVLEDYEHLLERVLTGRVDVAWMPPLLHAKAAAQGARLVALPQRGGWLTFRSAILVRRDDPVKDAASLGTPRAAWREKTSASGYLFPRLELATLGVKAYASEQFYGTVEHAALAVVRGEADLCTCFVSDPAARDPKRAASEVERALGVETASKLRVLRVTDPIPPDGFAVPASMPDAEATIIGQALLSLHESELGRKALSEILQAERMAPVNEGLLKSLRTWADAASARM